MNLYLLYRMQLLYLTRTYIPNLIKKIKVIPLPMVLGLKTIEFKIENQSTSPNHLKLVLLLSMLHYMNNIIYYFN